MKTLTFFFVVAISIVIAINVAYGDEYLNVCIEKKAKAIRLVQYLSNCDEYKEVGVEWIVKNVDEGGVSPAEGLSFKISLSNKSSLSCSVVSKSGEIIPTQRAVYRAQYHCPSKSVLTELIMEKNSISASCINLEEGEPIPPANLITICEILWDESVLPSLCPCWNESDISYYLENNIVESCNYSTETNLLQCIGSENEIIIEAKKIEYCINKETEVSYNDLSTEEWNACFELTDLVGK